MCLASSSAEVWIEKGLDLCFQVYVHAVVPSKYSFHQVFCFIIMYGLCQILFMFVHIWRCRFSRFLQYFLMLYLNYYWPEVNCMLRLRYTLDRVEIYYWVDVNWLVNVNHFLYSSPHLLFIESKSTLNWVEIYFWFSQHLLLMLMSIASPIYNRRVKN